MSKKKKHDSTENWSHKHDRRCQGTGTEMTSMMTDVSCMTDEGRCAVFSMLLQK